jgi:hypothetical protein
LLALPITSTLRAMTDTDDERPAGSLPEDSGEALDDVDLTRKDRSYSPSSERETAERQADPDGSAIDGVMQLPGTGGPDDSGDVEVPDDELDARIVADRSPGPEHP